MSTFYKMEEGRHNKTQNFVRSGNVEGRLEGGILGRMKLGIGKKCVHLILLVIRILEIQNSLKGPLLPASALLVP